MGLANRVDWSGADISLWKVQSLHCNEINHFFD